MLGGLYGIVRGNSTAAPGHGGRQRGGNAVAAFFRWLAANQGKRLLAAGVVAVALGVGLGAYATTNRQPGRPTISLERVNNESASVQITAEGLPSVDWYEAVLRGYSDSSVETDGVFLASARFSPGQDGKLAWKTRFHIPPDVNGKEITRVLVTVARDTLVDKKNCDLDADVTCLFIRIPLTAIPTATTSTQTTTTQ